VSITRRGTRCRPVGPCTRGPWIALALAAALALTACGESREARADRATAGTDAITAINPWVRVAIVPEGSDAPDAPPVNSAGYLVLTNGTDAADALVSVETTIADTAEIHSVTMDDGIMRMRPVDSMAVPAGGQATLEPGGYHIMLIGIHKALAEGDTVALRLHLRSGAVVEVAAPVRMGPPQS
jgi:copper(I)-binding protein